MNIVWLFIGTGALAFLVQQVAWPRTLRGKIDSGFVSHQWLAEHRLSQNSDPPR
jgi:hypothetical protein